MDGRQAHGARTVLQAWGKPAMPAMPATPAIQVPCPIRTNLASRVEGIFGLLPTKNFGKRGSEARVEPDEHPDTKLNMHAPAAFYLTRELMCPNKEESKEKMKHLQGHSSS